MKSWKLFDEITVESRRDLREQKLLDELEWERIQQRQRDTSLPSAEEIDESHRILRECYGIVLSEKS